MIGLVCALLVLGVAGVLVAIKIHHDNQVAAQHRRELGAEHVGAAAAPRSCRRRTRRCRGPGRHRSKPRSHNGRRSRLSSRNSITQDATSKGESGPLDERPGAKHVVHTGQRRQFYKT